ncbi:MAG TPA: hypothetical protein VF940_13265 [Streptosporangiaceae bacterium]
MTLARNGERGQCQLVAGRLGRPPANQGRNDDAYPSPDVFGPRAWPGRAAEGGGAVLVGRCRLGPRPRRSAV